MKLNKLFPLAAELFVLLSALVQFISTIGKEDLSQIWRIVYILLITMNIILILIIARKIYDFSKKIIPRKHKRKISNYLLDWIQSGHRIAIMSRDLSWVKDEIKEELIKKAKDGELIVFLPRSNSVSNELMSAGAEVKYYLYATENIHYTNNSIASRFIIARYEAHPILTTPIITRKYHKNDEYDSEEFPTKVSSDMVDIMRNTTHRTQPFDISDKDAIVESLLFWLSTGGRCFILSRDLSCASDERVKTCLIEKAERGELTIFMQKKNDIAINLFEHNADIRFYGTHDYIFKNRFIISHWGTIDSKIIIRSIHDNVHINHIYDSRHRIYEYAIEVAEFLNKAISPENHA